MVFKISFAALIHDIGKLLQWMEEIPEDYFTNNADLYLPFDRKRGIHTHRHALHTAYFLENTARDFLPQELFKTGSGEEYFVNLAARHHRPETALEWIVTEADRLSSSIDRAEFEKGEEVDPRKASAVRLFPIFERILKEDRTFDSPTDYEWFYPLAPISAQSIFPVKKQELSVEKAKEEYRNFARNFLEALKNLFHREHPELWARHFDSLYCLYASQVPAARAGRVIPDVSLYDHSRSAAALAGALYLYHKLENSLEVEAVKDEGPEKFLLVSGDFYGIQSFIFRAGGEERHHRAKLLRGRSFMVSLLCELAAERICEALGLSFLSVLFSAAGKFHLIAPNHPLVLEKVEEVQDELNAWLRELFYGEAAVGLSSTPFSAKKLIEEGFLSVWLSHLERLEEKKFKRFKLKQLGVFKDYLSSFNSDLKPPLCPLCGKRPSELKGDDFVKHRESESEVSCRVCRDQVFLGTKLVKNKVLAVFRSEVGGLKLPIFGRYQVKFFDEFERAKKLGKDCVSVWAYRVSPDGTLPKRLTFLPLSGYVPVYSEEDLYDERLLYGEESPEKKETLIEMIKEGAPKSFHHLAKKALKKENEECFGVAALGVLKADVDNLGAIFACGVPKRLFTLSRLATLSRRLNYFFTVYLPYALQSEEDGRFRETYTLFAGGDDLFLIGPWNTTLDLALFISQKFKDYTCQNPKIHLSAGVSFHKASTPVHLFEKKSEEALKTSKNKGRNRITVFGRTVTWEEFSKLCRIREELLDWVKDERDGISKRTLYRINELAELAGRERRLLERKVLSWREVQCAKWPAFLSYFLARWVEDKALRDELHEKIGTWLRTYGDAFVVALWPALYEMRKAKI